MGRVVLGAGPLGTALAERLAETGARVRLVGVMGNPVYDMPGTRPDSIDGTDPGLLAEICAGAEVVYLCLNAHYVDWYALFPPRLEAAIVAAGAVGARLVYHDDLSPYGDVNGAVLTEDLAEDPGTRKGRLRARMASTLLSATQAGKVRGVIGRSADMYGPGALNSSFGSTLGQRHFYPLLAGKPVSVIGDVDLPHTYCYVSDAARGLATLGLREEAVGQVWHLPAAPALSHRELLGVAFEQAGLPPRVRGSAVSAYVLRLIGRFQPDVGEVAELLYQFTEPLLVSHAKFEQAFGAAPTPHVDAISETLAWYRAHPLDALTP